MTARTRVVLAGLPSVLFVVLAAACGGDDSDDLSKPVDPGGSVCKSNTDCSGATPICDEMAGRCVQCLFATQCTAGAECIGNQCLQPTGCNSSLDCVNVPNATICDPVGRTCVECAAPADCSGTAECVAHQCVPYDPCTTSLDCLQGQVCATTLGRCVECETALDCPEGNVCVGNQCELRTECQSDNQCTPLGKLCDKTLGYCVDCLTNAQCPDAYHCEAGACALDACQAGASGCQGNSVVTCDAQGENWGVPQPCPASTSCTVSAAGASCQAWLCDAGLTYCVGDTLTTCSSDGLSIASSVDCAAQQKHCSAGACGDLVCAPNTVFCEGTQVKQCNADGSDSFVVQTCGPQQVCNPASASCVSQLCLPNSPVCNGDVATTCNAAGNGYTPGGTDCAAQGKSCEVGSCLGCPPNGAVPSNVRMTEVFIGTDDYIVLTNLGSCGVQLDTLRVRIASTDPANDLEVDLPSRVLAAGASVYLSDTNSAGPDDIVPPNAANIFLTPDTGEYVLLCSGPCSGGVVQDYFAHASGTQPPLPPGSVTFTPGPLTGITVATADTTSYKRVAYSGVSPAFKAADWTTGAASRPYENPTGCPPTEPVTGSACTGMMTSCLYGAVTCFCIGQWMCQ